MKMSWARASGRGAGRAVLCTLAALGACAVAAPVASASPSRAAFRAQRLCSAPRPGTAACLGMRLIAKSITNAQLSANARRQAGEVGKGATPKVTSKAVPGGLTPQSLHAAYSLPSETAGSATQTIGIVDAYNDPTAEADLAVYDTAFGLPACTTANGCFRKLNEQGKASPLPARSGEWSTEISLDLQMAHAICENCRLVLVEAASTSYGDLGAAVNAAASAGATEISNSYGGPEGSGYGSFNAPYNHPGVAVTVSSGDCGYFNQACGGTAAANFPADSSTVVAVGGTTLSHASGTWSSSAWNAGGSGCSHVFGGASWQLSASGFSATACGSGRSVADVSAEGDPYTGVDVYDSTPAGSGDGTGWGVWGGTSAAAPIVAGEFALGGGARGVAYPAATLYSHLGDGAALTDVSSGSNGSCSGTTACRATGGYDAPTGVGSPLALGAFTVAGAPVATAAPAISGNAEQGQVLAASAGTWSPAASSLSYRWAQCNAAGADCVAVSGATSATFTLPASAVGATVRAIVTGSNASGAGAAAESAPTAAIASSVPQVTGVSPASAITGESVTISGSALTATSQVRFGSLAATFTVVSAHQIQAVVPSGAIAASVSIVTPAGKATSTLKFTPSLSVTGETPSRAKQGAIVTIKGLGFTPTSTVSFHGAPATSVTYISATTLKAVVPAGASTGLIGITNSAAPIGSVTTAGSFVVS
jgi:IPT/TIG domain